jgi:arginase
LNIALVTVPYDHDVARWGCATGPQALLDAGIVDRLDALGHTVVSQVHVELTRTERTRDMITNLGTIGERLSYAVADACTTDAFALVLAGNCPHAVGACGGIARAGVQPGIVWFDAHGDLHTYATTETGFVGGMPFAVSLGWDLDDWREACGLSSPVAAQAAALIGANDLDSAEVAAIARTGIARLDADALDTSGDATHHLLEPRASAAAAWYLHLDIDVVGEEVPGATTPSDHPARGERVLASLRAATATVPVRVATIATYNPGGDPGRRGIPFIFSCVETILENAAGPSDRPAD